MLGLLEPREGLKLIYPLYHIAILLPTYSKLT